MKVVLAAPAHAARPSRLLFYLSVFPLLIFVRYVQGALATMAMVDYPFNASFVTPMPASPVAFACEAAGLPPTPAPPAASARHTSGSIGSGDGDVQPGDAWLFNALNRVQNVFLNWTAQLACHNTSAELLDPAPAAGAASRLPPSRAALAAAAPHGLIAATASGGGSGLGDITRPWNYM